MNISVKIYNWIFHSSPETRPFGASRGAMFYTIFSNFYHINKFNFSLEEEWESIGNIPLSEDSNIVLIREN